MGLICPGVARHDSLASRLLTRHYRAAHNARTGRSLAHIENDPVTSPKVAGFCAFPPKILIGLIGHLCAPVTYHLIAVVVIVACRRKDCSVSLSGRAQ